MRPEFPVEYDIDAHDRITRVNAGWIAEAKSACDPRLEDESAVGTSLWSLVQDPTSREIYARLIHRVRHNRVRIDFAFRCDTPIMRRLLRMRVTGLEHSAVQFQVRLIDAQMREPVELLRVGRPVSEQTIQVCGWCKRVPIPGGFWVEIEEALQVLGLFDVDPLPAIDHRICPDCRMKVMDGLLNDERPPSAVILGSLPAA